MTLEKELQDYFDQIRLQTHGEMVTRKKIEIWARELFFWETKIIDFSLSFTVKKAAISKKKLLLKKIPEPFRFATEQRFNQLMKPELELSRNEFFFIKNDTPKYYMKALDEDKNTISPKDFLKNQTEMKQKMLEFMEEQLSKSSIKMKEKMLYYEFMVGNYPDNFLKKLDEYHQRTGCMDSGEVYHNLKRYKISTDKKNYDQ